MYIISSSYKPSTDWDIVNVEKENVKYRAIINWMIMSQNDYKLGVKFQTLNPSRYTNTDLSTNSWMPP